MEAQQATPGWPGPSILLPALREHLPRGRAPGQHHGGEILGLSDLILLLRLCSDSLRDVPWLCQDICAGPRILSILIYHRSGRLRLAGRLMRLVLHHWDRQGDGPWGHDAPLGGRLLLGGLVWLIRHVPRREWLLIRDRAGGMFRNEGIELLCGSLMGIAGLRQECLGIG